MKKFIKWFGILSLALIFVILASLTLFLGWMKWSGERDWKRVQAELKAKGETLSLQELLPPRPSDHENFYSDPIWMQLADQVPVTKQYDGVSYETREPRLPENKLLINQWKTPLSKVEKESLYSYFPKDEIDHLDRYHAVFDLNIKLQKTPDSILRVKLAKTIASLITPADLLLKTISELSKRPSAYFPTEFIGFSTPNPHLVPIVRFSALFSSKTTSELALGNTGEALGNINTMLRMAQLMRRHPTWIEFMVRTHLVFQSLRGINQGIVLHIWDSNQLQEFQKSLSQIDLQGNLPWVFRAERAYLYKTDLKKQLAIAQPEIPKFFMSPLYLQYQQGDSVRFNQKIIETLEENKADAGLNEHRFALLHHNFIERLMDPYSESAHKNLFGVIESAAERQTMVYQTLIACALERYYLAHGAYPTSLDSLIPDFLERLPKAPTTGQAMLYRLTDTQHFQLWAPGWNLHSLGGKLGAYRGDGDIVWNQPLPTGERPIPKDP